MAGGAHGERPTVGASEGHEEVPGRPAESRRPAGRGLRGTGPDDERSTTRFGERFHPTPPGGTALPPCRTPRGRRSVARGLGAPPVDHGTGTPTRADLEDCRTPAMRDEPPHRRGPIQRSNGQSRVWAVTVAKIFGHGVGGVKKPEGPRQAGGRVTRGPPGRAPPPNSPILGVSKIPILWDGAAIRQRWTVAVGSSAPAVVLPRAFDRCGAPSPWTTPTGERPIASARARRAGSTQRRPWLASCPRHSRGGGTSSHSPWRW